MLAINYIPCIRYCNCVVDAVLYCTGCCSVVLYNTDKKFLVYSVILCGLIFLMIGTCCEHYCIINIPIALLLFVQLDQHTVCNLLQSVYYVILFSL